MLLIRRLFAHAYRRLGLGFARDPLRFLDSLVALSPDSASLTFSLVLTSRVTVLASQAAVREVLVEKSHSFVHSRLWRRVSLVIGGGLSVAEGEAWLDGREGRCIEMPPQQIIVAFSHKGNVSGRRIPGLDVKEISCFWNFPKEYLIFIHELAGMEVDDGEKKNKVKKG